MTSPGAEPGDVTAGLLLRVTEIAERLGRVDDREAAHHRGISGQLQDIAGTLSALEGLDERVTGLAQQLADDGDGVGGRGYRPGPQPPWWRMGGDAALARQARPLAGGEQSPGGPSPSGDAAELAGDIQRLSAWVSQVLQPGYGHLAASLGACWAQHPLCLYTLDWLHELWSVLYLTRRTPATLAAQAEFSTRLLPAAAAQMEAETSACTAHPRGNARPVGASGTLAGGARAARASAT